MTLFGSTKPATPMLCGGWTECDELHPMWEPQDVMVLNEVQYLDDMCEEHATPENVKHACDHGLLIHLPEKNAVVPTVLGMWLENCAAN